MYAVIKTGGKQYRVQPGDLMVVEKLDGDVGAEVAFDQVLMLGGEAGELTVGAPTIAGAVVRATLIETRKGDKVKVFKKIRRQGYRRTKGHRQFETVLRVTGLEAGANSAKWDGKVDLTPRSELNLRARGLAAAVAAPTVAATTAKAPKPAKAEAAPVAEEVVAAPVTEAAPKPAKAKAPKAEAAPAAEAEAKPAKKAAAPKAEKAEGDAKPAAKKAAKPKSDEA
jgi:large subunit ribosomal protein L21